LERQPSDLRGFEWRYLYGQCHSDELTTLSRQDQAVMAVRFSPVGKVLASWQATGAVELWDYQAQRHIRTLRDPLNEVADEIPDYESALAFSPDGRKLAAGAGTNILVWDMDTYQRTAVLRGHTGLVWFLVFAPDGKTLASGGADGTVRLWTVVADEVKEAAALPTDFHLVSRLAFSRDGNTLVGCVDDNTIQRWDVSNVQAPLALPPLLGHYGGFVLGLAFAPHTNLLVSISNDLIAWSLGSDAKEYSLRRLPLGRVPIGAPASLVFTPDGKKFVSGGSDRNITVWDPSGQEEPIKLRGHDGIVSSVDVSPDGRTLASGGHDGTLKLWDCTSFRQQKQRTLPHTGFVGDVAFSADSKLLASVGTGELRLWDAASEELLAKCKPGTASANSLALSPDGTLLALEDAGMIRLRAIPFLNELTNFPGAHPIFSPRGGELVYFVGEGGQRGIHWRNLKTQIERVRQTDGWDVRCLAVAADDHSIAVGMRNRVLLLNADSPTQVKEMGKPGGDMVTKLAFSPDGGMLASANWDGEARLWDLRNPRQTMKAFTAHHGMVWAVAFSPDGRTLATGGDDYTIKLWNLASLQEAAVLRGHAALVAALAFSPDGRQLASCGGDGTVRLWRAPTFAEIAAEHKGKERTK
jgi:WD40 repeat protein